MRNLNIIPFFQAVYFFLTAIWPFIHLESFLFVTGPKTDIWLVKTVSLLLLPYAVLLVYLSFSGKKNLIIALSISICCLSLIIIDLYYYFKGVIRWVYLIDCFLQIFFLIYWMYYIRLKLRNY